MQVLKKFNKTNFKKGDSGRAKNLDELINIWGSPECKSSEKVLYNKEGLNLYYSILLSDNENGEYDGNDVERCELGINEWREKGSIDGEWPLESTFTLYKEGSHNVTFFSLRLNNNFPINQKDPVSNDDYWQLVMQMKQTFPSNHDGVPIIALHAEGGKWQLFVPKNVDKLEDAISIWATPDNSIKRGIWVNFAFDVFYSQDPKKGFIKVYVDINGDGDFLDAGEESPLFHRATLVSEIKKYSSGVNGDKNIYINTGESIPSHLRIGIYHDANIDCGESNGCSLDLDNVEIFKVE